MIALRFGKEEHNYTYHLFDEAKYMLYWMRENYEDVVYRGDIVLYSFEEMRTYARVIIPITHEKPTI